jgi:hypothetical protein
MKYVNRRIRSNFQLRILFVPGLEHSFLFRRVRDELRERAGLRRFAWSESRSRPPLFSKEWSVRSLYTALPARPANTSVLSAIPRTGCFRGWPGWWRRCAPLDASLFPARRTSGGDAKGRRSPTRVPAPPTTTIRFAPWPLFCDGFYAKPSHAHALNEAGTLR